MTLSKCWLMESRTFKSFRRLAGLLALFVFMLLLLPRQSSAQYFAFGKNRVQYNNFQWRYIQTEHFDIYYYSGQNYYLAEFTATTLESAYQQLSKDFRHDISERISVIIYDSHNDFAQTNVVALPTDSEGIAGVTDLYKNRMTIPFMGDYASFRHTLHHELVHAVMNDMFYGGSLQNVVSNNIQLNFPLWFSEGICEYTSLGWDTNTDSFIRDAVINSYLPPIPRLRGYFAYRGGQSVWNYIVEEYGREKISEIFHRIKTTRNVEVAFKQALGLNIKELSDKWKEHLKKKYYPEVGDRESMSEVAELITEREKSGTYNTSPEISPQGDKIALITNKRGFFDVIVINAVTGETIKTLIKGEDNVNFESLNILNPNLSWSPDGRQLALSAKSEGKDDIAIVNYKTGKIKKLKFPRVDAVGSVSWSPDGEKIAFDGNIGPYQDIFVYNMESGEFINLTNDIFSDLEPAWANDSETVYFKSDRGNFLSLNRYKVEFNAFQNTNLYQTDLYEVSLGDNEATRLTKTPLWSEYQPVTTDAGDLYFISDQNGIPNIYHLDKDNRTIAPITDLSTGVRQISISSDGSRIALNAYNEGYLDVFLLKEPLSRRKSEKLKPNHWAERRKQEPITQRVPAVQYAMQMAERDDRDTTLSLQSQLQEGGKAVSSVFERRDADELLVDSLYASRGNSSSGDFSSTTDTTVAENAAPSDTTASDTSGTDNTEIDFRNYVFGSGLESDTTVQDLTGDDPFDPEDNVTQTGEYQPKDYRLKFSPDITYAGGQVSTYYGTYGYTQVVFSDLLANHRIGLTSNLVFDLRNSDYSIQYAYLKQRTNYFANYFHTARNYQTFYGELLRFRTYGGGITAQYPINKFKRIEASGSVIAVSKDYSRLGDNATDNETSSFLYPQVTFTSDNTLPGFITPQKGTRYSVSLTGSPPVSPEVVRFASLIGDYRHYISLGNRYTIALRASGGASFFRDSQTFFMGGMQNWINQKWARNSIPTDRLEDTFFTLPALPMRGHEFNSVYGDRFGLINAEFRFPLIAAAIPGPLPILPLYNIQGIGFIDFGAAWGFDNPNTQDFDPELNFQFTNDNGEMSDLLLGSGFGLRTILLGLPFRYDIGWPYTGSGFGDPIHYFTIGIDF